MPTKKSFELLLKAKPWTLKPVKNKRDRIKKKYNNIEGKNWKWITFRINADGVNSYLLS